jgi:streptogramin lyase
MPAIEQLPDDLKALARRNALELSDARWRYDVDRLIEVVERTATAASGPVRSATAGARPGGWRPTPRQRRGALAAGAGVLVAGAAAFALLGGGGCDDPGRAAPPPPLDPQKREPRRSRIDITHKGVLARPNALTIAAGDVWALSNSEGAISLYDAATGDPGGREKVGDGASSLAAGFGLVWVTKESTRSVLRINAKTHRRVPGGAIEVGRPGRNVAVVAGARAVWVGVRNSTQEDLSPESVVRIDPSSSEQQEITVPGGVQDIAVGAGAVWVSNRFSSTVTRIRTSTRRQDVVPVGAKPKGIAVGEGAVWVASAGEDMITRINPRSLETKKIPLQAIPERVAVGGGSVWVTAKEAGRLIRIDAKTREVLERIDTGSRPYALDITRGRAVWLTVLDDDGLQRVRFYRR